VNGSLWVIAGTAASLGFVHTLIGPDHYLPFIVMSRARGWSLPRTLLIALSCGLGHVLSSVVLGLAGVALGVAVFKLESIESFRGGIAAWLLIGFGFAYFLWGLRRGLRRRSHTHAHAHEDGPEHEHVHGHDLPHAHVHGRAGRANITPWVLFTIFVFGPCEPLIPLVMYPAAQHHFAGVVLVAAVFGAATILTMLALIAAASWGAKFLRLGKLERYVHAMAGAMIFLSGLSVQVLGL
jgi:ABC-type nickel/cobalt efflux system permease component RcnA